MGHSIWHLHAHQCPQAPSPLQDVTGVRERVSLPSHQTTLTAPGKSLSHRLQHSLSAHADPKTRKGRRHLNAGAALGLQAAVVGRACHPAFKAGLSPAAGSTPRWQVCSQAARLSACQDLQGVNSTLIPGRVLCPRNSLSSRTWGTGMQ